MSTLERRSGFPRAVSTALKLFSILLIVRVFGKWLMADTVEAWLIWLRGDWVAEFVISALAAIAVTFWTVLGSSNGYVDRG